MTAMDGLIEQIEDDTVFVRLVDNWAWRFGLTQFEEVTTPHDWQGEILWDWSSLHGLCFAYLFIVNNRRKPRDIHSHVIPGGNGQ